jgi:hypothetical protein
MPAGEPSHLAGEVAVDVLHEVGKPFGVWHLQQEVEVV